MSEPEVTKAASKKKAKIECLLCDFKANPDLTYGGQVKQLHKHWRENEFRFKWNQDHYDVEEVEYQVAAGISIIAALWTDLDEITGPALKQLAEYKAWKSAVPTDPWSSTTDFEEIKNEVTDLKMQLDMANKFKTGRGLAMAIKRMSHPYWNSVDEVVAHAVARARAKAAHETIFTPGTGGGESADRAWYQQKNGKALPGCDGMERNPSPSPVATPTVPTTTMPPEQTPKPATSDAVTPEVAAGIKQALSAGFSAEKLAELYKLTVAQVRALA